MAFLIQYETTISGRRLPVTRYDSSHGRPHQDLLDRHGNLISKRWLDSFTLQEALEVGRHDRRANWQRYKAEFLGEQS